MLTVDKFVLLKEKTKKFRHSNFNHLDYDDIIESEIIRDDEELILLLSKSGNTNKIYWATDYAEYIIEVIKKIKENLYVDFVPISFQNLFESAGFIICSEWIDFFNNEICNTPILNSNINDICLLQPNEILLIKEMATMCVGFTRGFEAEKEQWFKDWLVNNDIIVIKDKNHLIGYCCVSIYAENTIVWIRRIAVNPLNQGKGYGNILVEQALSYGINKGAVRSFLHADITNVTALNLYKKFGFVPQSERGQLNMKRPCSI